MFSWDDTKGNNKRLKKMIANVPPLWKRGDRGDLRRLLNPPKSPFSKGGLAALNIPWIDGYGIFLVTIVCLVNRLKGGFWITLCVMCG
jgi:hypothetical protein